MRALLIIDVQNDFVPGGALAVPEGDQVVAVANELMGRCELVVASQDWHPANHGSFASQHPGRDVGEVVQLGGLSQILWPDHCVQGSRGAEFVEGLSRGCIDHVIHKGTDVEIDSYSAFFDNDHRKETELQAYLKGRGVDELLMVGLATDYCVKYTALDARELGWPTTVVLEGVRGVNLQPEDSDKAIEEMRRSGASLVRLEELK